MTFMGIFKNLFGKREVQWRTALRQIQRKFSVFRALLEQQNQVLKAMSRLEERLRKNLRPDGDALDEIRQGIAALIERMIELGGGGYRVLRQRYRAICEDLDHDLTAKPRDVGEFSPPSDFVIPLDRIGWRDVGAVGNKNANLGELKSRLGLPVPDGFAVSTRACRYFVTVNHLVEEIHALFRKVATGGLPPDLESLSAEITSLMVSCPVPDELKAAIERNYDDLTRRCPEGRFAMRSSAIDEDTALTFAGQYLSLLNVRKEELLSSYKRVLASQFAPAALGRFLARGPAESDLAMGVVCMAFIDAAASGVIYTRNPLDADSDYMLVNAVLGLGSYLVEGILTPDVFHISRQDGTILFSRLARKPVQLEMCAGGGVAERAVPKSEQENASIGSEQLRLLVQYALQVETHYEAPQDIEWAIDRQGQLFLLQTRPLRVIRRLAAAPVVPELRAKRLAEKGTPICPGAGGGPIFHLGSMAELDRVPEGVVLVAQNPSPKLIAVMRKVHALVTEVGGSASHMATLAREAGLPTVAGIADAGRLPPGLVVTVDATAGTIYEGLHADLIESRRRQCEASEANKPPESLGRVLEIISHLNLLNPGTPEFCPENCRTFHDIIRFIHQKAMEEMFLAAKRTAYKDQIGQRLKTRIPLLVNIIHLEPEMTGRKDKRWIAEDEIESVPMKALWSGVLEEGWPAPPVAPDLKGFLAVVGANIGQENQPDFSESSYAFVSREYMLLNLRMGYHFATIEALVTSEAIKNYIRLQYKEGGASLDRRIRRIRLICELLTRMGFEHSCEGDFLDATISYQDASFMTRRLQLLGRINIITKQLDMALANDAVARWYTEDFVNRLGLGNALPPLNPS
jgi:pyruvate,water dikinase